MTPRPAPSAGPPAQVRILIVADHPLVRLGMQQVIRAERGLEMCAEAESANEALQLVASARPYLALVDLSLAGGTGLGQQDKAQQCGRLRVTSSGSMDSLATILQPFPSRSSQRTRRRATCELACGLAKLDRRGCSRVGRPYCRWAQANAGALRDRLTFPVVGISLAFRQ